MRVVPKPHSRTFCKNTTQKRRRAKVCLATCHLRQTLNSRFIVGQARQDAIETYTWSLEELALRPKDELLFWIEVRDNDGYNGPKWGKSEERTLRIPSLTEFFDDIGEQEDEVSSDMEEISESFEAIQERYDEFKENLIDQPEGNYEQQVQLEIRSSSAVSTIPATGEEGSP